MKNKFIITALMLFFGITVFFYSCKNDTKNEETMLSDNHLKDSPENLKTIDYKQIYDELSPKGEWIQIRASDVNINLSDNSIDKKGNSLIGELLGIKTAYAQFDADLIFVWKPAPDLAVALNTDLDGNQDGMFDRPGVSTQLMAASPAPYVPYTNGRWLYTDNAGWYYAAATPQEEITSHYGRWVYDPTVGYVWVPGNVWAPAWVDMRENNDYVAWAPLPYDVIIDNNRVVYSDYVIPEERYVVIEKRYFVEPAPTKYMYMYHSNNGKVKIKEMRRFDGLIVQDNRYVYMGPDIQMLEPIYGKPIEVYTVNDVSALTAAGINGRVLGTYRPQFTTVTDRVVTPSKFMTKNDFVSSGKTYLKLEDRYSKGNSGNDKNMSKGNEKNFNKNKGNDVELKDRFQNKGKSNNKNIDKGNDKNFNKGNEKNFNKGNDKGNNKGNDKNYNKGNNKGNEKNYNKGNDKGSKGNDKGNDKGNNKGSDKGKGKR